MLHSVIYTLTKIKNFFKTVGILIPNFQTLLSLYYSDR
jgi:hypothetical protein